MFLIIGCSEIGMLFVSVIPVNEVVSMKTSHAHNWEAYD